MSEPEQPTTRVSGTQVRGDGQRTDVVAQRMRARVVDGPDDGVEAEVRGSHLSIGGASTNDLVLTDPLVSRRHCELRLQDDEYLLRDLGSTNGTHLDGQRVHEAPVPPGARLRVGRTEIVFEPKKKWVRIRESEHDRFGALVGCSKAMRTLFGLLEKIAPTDLSCIVLGETGTGKELTARAIHEHSPRAEGPFVVVDCGAVSDTLVESELFGHEKGAFTGADRARAGAFEAASGGTVFLDEIGELSPELQPKLLRVIEEREVKRLGTTEPVAVDVRVVCATHRDLASLVEQGGFREDLYYRLAEVVVEIPPLAQRPEDVKLVAERLAEQESRHGRSVELTERTLDELASRSWPGNVRELRNVVRRAVALSSTGKVEPEDLSIAAGPRPRISRDGEGLSLPAGLERLTIKEARERWNATMERQYLERLMEDSGGDVDRAAEVADVHVKSMRRMLRRHGLIE